MEQKEQKYCPKKHEKRLDVILKNWENILAIIREEIPSMAELDALFLAAGLPKTPAEIGLENEILPMTLQASKDIRDKYVLSRLLWDLGMEL